MSKIDILPDSRLRNPKDCVIVDWPLMDGTTVRLELEPIFCFSCGKPNGYVPREIMSFVSWLCMPCSEKYGELASNWQASDGQFWQDVANEMKDRFGHVLDQRELCILAERGELGSALEKLEKESPYKLWHR